MHLKILLPFKVFAEKPEVSRIIAESSEGFFALLPRRRDCVVALIPSILTYSTQENTEYYVAIDEGLLVKTGSSVLISVRNAIAGDDLSQLHQLIEQQFLALNEQEQNLRLVLAKLETGFVRRFMEFNRG
ncbi:MAG: F0F1 ATP synthase subunit epsilon [Methylococcaceae bacterium]